uniref:LOB domain-containing protein n=1 Tax=Kalanchoe fedtschenkoi TaxID=63787 RepID=A0A7N0UNN1_KALFE
MSCNGCRVLRKGCRDTCILRPCLEWIDSPESQGHATIFVAKFFGRAGLMSFISAVPESQRPALFQSLLFEACGRTVNPVNGAVGLLGSGNWHVCEVAVETVLQGGKLQPLRDLARCSPDSDEASEVAFQPLNSQMVKRMRRDMDKSGDVDLSLTMSCLAPDSGRSGSPSMDSEKSGTMRSDGNGGRRRVDREVKLLDLFC